MSKLEAIKSATDANPVDLFVAACEAVKEEPDNETARQEISDLMDGVFAEVASFWKGRPDKDRPSQSDIIFRVGALVHSFNEATSVLKRRLLWNAFWNSLKPEFYGEGISDILWEKIQGLEHPDTVFLAKVIAETDPTKSGAIRGGPARDWRGDHRGNQLAIRASDAEAEYADRLSRADLVDVAHSDNRSAVRLVSWTGLAPKIVAFVAPQT